MQIISWNSTEFKAGEVVVNVLTQNANSKEIQILMAKNSLMSEHKAPFDITVQVLKGEIEFTAQETQVLKELDMISLEANKEAHSLHALKDSIVRLSLAKNDSFKRVQGILKR